MNSDGSSPTRLTDGRARSDRLPRSTHVYDTDPAWSPDGVKIAFISNRNSTFALYTMSADGSNVQVVIDTVANPSSPAWSPDGSKIAFTGGVPFAVEPNNPFTDIYAINADGTALTKLTADSGLNSHPSWSPDGRQIVFGSNRDPDGREKIWVMNADGTGQRRLTNIHDTSNPLFYGDRWPSWSPDGTKILFNGYRDFNGARNCGSVNCSEIFVMNVDGTNDHALTNDSTRGGVYETPKWSPDGTKIVVHLSLGTIADVRNGIDRGRAIIVMNADGSNQINISNRGKYGFNAAENAFYDVAADWQPLLTPPNFAPSVIGFSAASYSVYEDAGSVTIIVRRTGNLTAPASCLYVTMDDTATVKSDYTSAVGTVRFAAGESLKTISIPIIDNGDVRGTRSFKIVLSDNEGNATFIGGTKEATVIIMERDTAPRPTNPIDEGRTFVRMHYVDFLNREPDTGGWDYWTNQIVACGTNLPCVLSRRVGVSAAFFIEQEFQQTGAFVIRFKLINPPYSAFNFLAFMRDVQAIEGNALGQPDAAAKLEANKHAYIHQYFDENRVTVSWGRTDAEYVDLLFYYVQLYSGATLLQADRDAYVAGLSAGTETRASIYRKVIDHPLYQQATYNPSFVLMQYYGYLRREPDQGGYDFWLDVLNSRVPGNFRSMVCAFITSPEYQQRFSPFVTHSNAECAQ